MPTRPNVHIEVAGQGGFFPMQQSVAGSSGYPVAAPIKEATVPYWSSGMGVPTFSAPLGSTYTDTTAAVGQPVQYLRVLVTQGSGTALVWQAMPGPINGSTIIPGTLPGSTIIPGTIPGTALAHGDYVDLLNAQIINGAKTFTSPPTMSGANITVIPGAGIVLGSIPMDRLGFVPVQVFTPAGSPIPVGLGGQKFVMGTATVVAGSNVVVTLALGAVFFNASSYRVTVTSIGAASTLNPFVTYTSGSSFSISATNGAVLGWIAVGS